MRCNAYCKFCGSRCGDHSTDVLKEELDAETIQKCFREISQSYDPKEIMINVTGGEPLLRSDLFDIMAFAAKLGFPWGMVTNASRQLLMFFEWGEQSSHNCFELLAGLAGFRTGHLIVVEHIIPGNLENRSENTAEFSVNNFEDMLRELVVLNRGRSRSHEKFKISDEYSLVGIAHTHPLALSAVLSIPDIELQGQMEKRFGEFVSLLINPQKKQIAAYCNSVFSPVDLELLTDNESQLVF